MHFPLKPLIAATAISLLLLSPALTAGERQKISTAATGEQTIAVPFPDLNLNTPQGVKALEARIRTAARKVCNSSIGVVAAHERTATMNCYRRSSEAAIASIPHRGTVILVARADTAPPDR